MKVIVLQKGGLKQHSTIEEATRFFGKELMSTRMTNTLTIRVAMRVTGRAKKTTRGHVHMLHNGSSDQKVFNINIDRDMPLATQLQVLAHEMIHVQQIATKRFQSRRWKSDKKLHVRWEGKDIGEGWKIPYREQPWEVEAFANQLALAGKFCDVLECRWLQSA